LADTSIPPQEESVINVATKSSAPLVSFDGTDPSANRIKQDLPKTGKITQTIGQGDDAKNSIAYATIKWTYWAMGIIIFLLVCINVFLYCRDKVIPDVFSDILQTVFGAGVPIITLALGYAFGSGKTK